MSSAAPRLSRVGKNALAVTALGLLAAGVVISRLLGVPTPTEDTESMALTKLVETGQRHVLRGKTSDGQFSVAITEYYESHERDTVFQSALAERLGYAPESHTVFVVEIMGPLVTTPQTQPRPPRENNDSDLTNRPTPLHGSTTNAAVPISLERIELTLRQGGTVKAVPLSSITTANSVQARILLNTYTGPAVVGVGQRVLRYVAFPGKLILSEVTAATVQVNRELTVTLRAAAENYPVPPGLPMRRRG